MIQHRLLQRGKKPQTQIPDRDVRAIFPEWEVLPKVRNVVPQDVVCKRGNFSAEKLI